MEGLEGVCTEGTKVGRPAASATCRLSPPPSVRRAPQPTARQALHVRAPSSLGCAGVGMRAHHLHHRGAAEGLALTSAACLRFACLVLVHPTRSSCPPSPQARGRRSWRARGSPGLRARLRRWRGERQGEAEGERQGEGQGEPGSERRLRWAAVGELRPHAPPCRCSRQTWRSAPCEVDEGVDGAEAYVERRQAAESHSPRRSKGR